MSLPQPTASNAYTVLPGHKYKPDFWTAILGELHGRLNALESVATDWNAALGTQSTALVDGQFTSTVQGYLAQIQAEVNTLIDDIDAAGDRLAAINAGGLAADTVSIVAIDDFAPETVQDSIAALVGSVAALTAALNGQTAALTALSYDTLRPVTITSSAITAQAGHRIYADSSGGAVPITMPTTADAGSLPIDVSPTGLLVTLLPNASQTIGGQTSVAIDVENTGVTLTLVGTDWKIKKWGTVNG